MRRNNKLFTSNLNGKPDSKFESALIEIQFCLMEQQEEEIVKHKRNFK